MLFTPVVSRLSLTLAALAGLAGAARGGFVIIPQPNAAYLDSTTEFSIPSSGPPVQSLAAGNLTITFSQPMIPVLTATLYSSYDQQQKGGVTSRVLTFSEPLETFGLDMRPNLTVFFPAPMTAQFFNDNTLLGTIKLSVSEYSPRLFAATDTDTPFTSVQLSVPLFFGVAPTAGFLISDVRAEVATPEPASLVLFGLGMFGMLGHGWRRRTAVGISRC
jgi:hypothetical protein